MYMIINLINKEVMGNIRMLYKSAFIDFLTKFNFSKCVPTHKKRNRRNQPEPPGCNKACPFCKICDCMFAKGRELT